MATVLKVAGANFSANAIGFIPPIASGLTAWHFMGDTLAKSLVNRAVGGTDATAAGTPTVGANSLTMKSGVVANSHLVTAVADTTAVSMFGVVKTADDGSTSALQAVWMGCLGSNVGITLFVRSTGKDGFQWINNVGGTPTTDFLTTAGTAALSTWRFIAGTTDGTNYTLYDKTAGTSIAKTTASARILGSAPYLIGNYYSSTRQGVPEEAIAGLYNRMLSAGEVETLYQYCKTYMAARSITI